MRLRWPLWNRLGTNSIVTWVERTDWSRKSRSLLRSCRHSCQMNRNCLHIGRRHRPPVDVSLAFARVMCGRRGNLLCWVWNCERRLNSLPGDQPQVGRMTSWACQRVSRKQAVNRLRSIAPCERPGDFPYCRRRCSEAMWPLVMWPLVMDRLRGRRQVSAERRPHRSMKGSGSSCRRRCPEPSMSSCNEHIGPACSFAASGKVVTRFKGNLRTSIDDQ